MRKVVIVLALVILGGLTVGFLWSQGAKFPQPTTSTTPVESAQPTPLVEDNIPQEVDVFFNQPVIELSDVSGGIATGQAWIAVDENVTHHRVIASDLPRLTNGDFYEGWLVRPAPDSDFFSTGEMTFDEAKNIWVLEYEVEGDKSDYANVVITLEPDDGDPAPAEHILE